MKVTFIIFFAMIFLYNFNLLFGQGIIADHNAVQDFDSIPAYWLEQAKQFNIHYGHTSHGAQLTTGLNRVEDSTHNFEVGQGFLPTGDALCMFDGTYKNESYVSYVEPDDYWESEAGMNCTRYVLENYSDINISMFMWCWQIRTNNTTYVQGYLDAMSQLEQEYPDVTFIYITGHCQNYEGHHFTGPTSYWNPFGWNTHINNEYIRQYCQNNNKVLFDFGDIDCWWNGDCDYGDYNGNIFPREHDHYNLDQAAHTSYENCENKGRAVWWLMARLAGWEGVSGLIEDPQKSPKQFKIYQNYPNPFNPTTKIKYVVDKHGFVKLFIFNTLGQIIRTLIFNFHSPGTYTAIWDGKNDLGKEVSCGTYYYSIQMDNINHIRKMILLR